MSINGINPLLANLGAIGRPEVARPNTDRAGNAGTPGNAGANANVGANAARPALKAQTPIAGQGATQSAVPAEAPAGTDPTLWSVLTNDERNFFAKTAALGPLTYSRIKAATNPAPPAARGVRLDVRA
jgi:hypothetical protein